MKKLFAVCLLAGLVTLAGCSSTQTASAQYIGMEAARSAALQDAGVTEGEFTGVTLEEKDGTVYYEVEFTAGGAKYEYAVDALTGTIIEGKWKGNDGDQGRARPAPPPRRAPPVPSRRAPAPRPRAARPRRPSPRRS